MKASKLIAFSALLAAIGTASIGCGTASPSNVNKALTGYNYTAPNTSSIADTLKYNKDLTSMQIKNNIMDPLRNTYSLTNPIYTNKPVVTPKTKYNSPTATNSAAINNNHVISPITNSIGAANIPVASSERNVYNPTMRTTMPSPTVLPLNSTNNINITR